MLLLLPGRLQFSESLQMTRTSDSFRPYRNFLHIAFQSKSVTKYNMFDSSTRTFTLTRNWISREVISTRKSGSFKCITRTKSTKGVACVGNGLNRTGMWVSTVMCTCPTGSMTTDRITMTERSVKHAREGITWFEWFQNFYHSSREISHLWKNIEIKYGRTLMA